MKNSKVNQVENFEKLIVFCNTHGAVYKPSKGSLQMTALHSLLTQAQQMMKAVKAARTQYENSLNARKGKFSVLPRLASRIVEALRASGASSETMLQARVIRNMLTGAKKRKHLKPYAPAPTEGTEAPRPYTLSQMDMASRIDNFERLVMWVAAYPDYQPAEDDLSVASLQNLVHELRTLNRAVINTYMDKKNLNRSLNKLLFQSNGVYEVATLVKGYMRSIFGKRTKEDKEISLLTFIRQ